MRISSEVATYFPLHLQSRHLSILHNQRVSTRASKSEVATKLALQRLLLPKSAVGRMTIVKKRKASKFDRRVRVAGLNRILERQIGQSVFSARRTEVLSYAHLPKGWNSYDAEAPGERAISLAVRFIDLVEKHACSIEWIAPSVDDSVMITVDASSGKQEWEFFGNGDTAVMYRDENGVKAYVDLEEARFEQFLTR